MEFCLISGGGGLMGHPQNRQGEEQDFCQSVAGEERLEWGTPWIQA